jgi:hypothetical protein
MWLVRESCCKSGRGRQTGTGQALWTQNPFRGSIHGMDSGVWNPTLTAMETNLTTSFQKLLGDAARSPLKLRYVVEHLPQKYSRSATVITTKHRVRRHCSCFSILTLLRLNAYTWLWTCDHRACGDIGQYLHSKLSTYDLWNHLWQYYLPSGMTKHHQCDQLTSVGTGNNQKNIEAVSTNLMYRVLYTVL